MAGSRQRHVPITVGPLGLDISILVTKENRRTRKNPSKLTCSNMVITKLCQELDVYLLKVAEYSLLPDRADQSLKKNQTLERSIARFIFFNPKTRPLDIIVISFITGESRRWELTRVTANKFIPLEFGNKSMALIFLFIYTT